MKSFGSLLMTLVLMGAGAAHAVDPLASNNGLYPDAPAVRVPGVNAAVAFQPNQYWDGPLRLSNYDYPTDAKNEWLTVKPKGALTLANAHAYLDAMKKYIAPSMRQMIENPNEWSKHQQNWYSPIWTAQGSPVSAADPSISPESGREAILGTFTGQVIRRCTFAAFGLTTDMQNHTVIYYDPVAAMSLKRLWADPLKPNVSRTNGIGSDQSMFAEGAIVVKAGGVTATPAQWPAVAGAAVWHVYRPELVGTTTGGPCNDTAVPDKITFGPIPVVTPLRVLQFDMIVKDKEASPRTGFVFMAWVYSCNDPKAADCGVPGTTPWDRMVPLGITWGSDPEATDTPSGRHAGTPLQENWISPQAPAYAMSTLGWGGRLSGPIDVSERHGVQLARGGVLDKGVHVSSCIACHIASQYPFIANLYPSPNITFPQDGQRFLMYEPGSKEFARWFQDQKGNTALSAANDQAAIGLSYDMVQTFALSAFNRAAGNAALIVPKFGGH
jgi:hypothetical protein